MNKGLWVAIGLLILALAWLVSVKLLYKPSSIDTASASNTKIMMSLDKFSGYHHDAQILLKELRVLKADIENAIATKDNKLLANTVNNTYRVMDNVNINRIPTIAPFEVCDEALDTLGLYAVASKSYYSDADKENTNKVDSLKNAFNSKFAQCQSIVNDKPVAALYQDYQ